MDRPVHILVGEDNPADVYLIRQAIQEHNLACTMQVARNGAEVLQLLKDAALGRGAPDLVLLDLNLPRHDGLEILRFIRDTEVLTGLTVVILTSSDSPADTRAALDLGATSYIRKPSNLESFMNIGATLQSLLDDKQKTSV